MTATALPPAIETKLSGLRARLRRLAAVHGLARLVVAVVGFALGTYILDRLLDLPQLFRLVLLAGGGGAIAWAAWRFLVRPVTRTVGDDAIALRVERAHPELRDELISAVQLARLPAEQRVAYSPALVREVIEEAARHAEAIDFDRVAGGGEVRRVALLALGLAAVVIGFGAANPREARIWFERSILLGDTPWPRSVELEIALSDTLVARGDDVVVTAALRRGSPSRVVIHPTFEKAGRGDELPMVQMHDTFRAVFENVTEPFTFYVEGGDYRSQRFAVDVRARPQVEEMSVALEYPAYTGLPSPEEPQKDGNLKVPAGTRVRWTARASQPLREAEVSFGGAGAVEGRREALAGDHRTFAGEFVAKESTPWSFRLVSIDGFESPAAAQYTIRVVPDRFPEVVLKKPGRNKDAARAASVPLAVEVRDDYRPVAAALVYVVQRAGSARTDAGQGAGTEKRFPLAGLPPEEPGAKAAEIAHAFALGPLDLAVNDRVTYWVEAVDNRAPGAETTSLPPELRGRSEKYQLRIVSDDEIQRTVQSRLKRLRDELLATHKAQKTTRDDMLALSGEVRDGAELEAHARRRVTYAELDQRKVAQRIDRAADEFAEIREELAANGAGKPEDAEWLAELEAASRGVAREKATPAAAGLQVLRQSEAVEAQRLKDVLALEQDVLDALQDIARRLDKWDVYNEVVRDARDLLDAQKRILEETEKRMKLDQDGHR